METNTAGVFLMSRAVLPSMLAAGRGSIINITINHETMVRRGFSPYGPSKAALEAMSEVWARELESQRAANRRHRMGRAGVTGVRRGYGW